MTEQEALQKMVPPGARRVGKWRQGVIQVWVTRACDNACFGCTQGSNLGGKPGFITPDQFRAALESLRGYFGVVGMFGGNPALHPQFESLCEMMRQTVPYQQRGIWCNNPVTVRNAETMAKTFNPAHSNLNVHLNREAYDKFKAGWPQCSPVGLDRDSRHSPVHLAMKDVIADEGTRWDLISRCDINQHWSAMIGVFRGELRAWFCEVAGAQAILHQDDPDYPDTGIKFATMQRPDYWWRADMKSFALQVRKHCHECGVPLRGHGELAMSDDPNAREQTSETHRGVFKPKRVGRPVEVVTDLVQLGTDRLGNVVRYLENGQPK